MENLEFVQELNKRNSMFKHASTLEDVLCFTVLTAHENYFEVYNVDDARLVWLNNFHGECEECPYIKHCVAHFINE